MAKILLTGTLHCAAEDIEDVLAVMDEHIRLSRAEAGCLQFELWQDEVTPTLFHVNEVFRDAASFEAHQARTRGSDWFRVTHDMTRDFRKVDA